MITLMLVLIAVTQTQDAKMPLPDPLQAGWKGKPACERLIENDRQRVLRCTFAPGGGHERHFHRPHVGYALSGGRMRITDGSGMREAVLTTGSAFSSDGVGWHEVLNVGDTTVQYLIVESKDRAEPGK
jgi:quercetin dioxygenase-like cupin family protein